MKLKKVGKVILASVFAATLFFASVSPVSAADDKKPTYLKSVSSKMHASYYENSTNEWSIAHFDLKNYDDTIDVKYNSKNMYADITYKYGSYNKVDGKEEGSGAVEVGAVFKKAGNYKITIIEKNAKGKQVFSKTVTVYCNDSRAIKKATLNGKESSYSLVNIKSGKFKVTMNKGYKLKKVEYGVYEKKSKDASYDRVWKTIKNGGKIVFGKYAYKDVYNNEMGDKNSDYYYYSHTLSKGLVAITEVRVTYVDKYTKEDNSISYLYYRYLK